MELNEEGKKERKDISKAPDGIKVLLGIFNKKNLDIKLTVKEIKKAEDNI